MTFRVRLALFFWRMSFRCMPRDMAADMLMCLRVGRTVIGAETAQTCKFAPKEQRAQPTIH